MMEYLMITGNFWCEVISVQQWDCHITHWRSFYGGEMSYLVFASA
jgi:hypothetical protein